MSPLSVFAVSKTCSRQFNAIVCETTHPVVVSLAPIHLKHQKHTILSLVLFGNNKNCHFFQFISRYLF